MVLLFQPLLPPPLSAPRFGFPTMSTFGQVWNWVVRSVFDPCFKSVGLVCGGVRVTRVVEAAPGLPTLSPPPNNPQPIIS